MTKEDIKKAVLIGVVGGITAAVTALVLIWAYIYFIDWYKEFQREREQEELADDRSGDYCPECSSTNVGKYFYGYYRPVANDSTEIAVKEKRLIPGGCVLETTSPKYRCNSCSYKWGNYVADFKRMEERDEESN